MKTTSQLHQPQNNISKGISKIDKNEYTMHKYKAYMHCL